MPLLGGPIPRIGPWSSSIADDGLRRAALGDQIGQLAHHPPTRDRRVDHRSQAFARDIVDDVEHAKAAASDELVMDEVEAPALALAAPARGPAPDCRWRAFVPSVAAP